MNECVGRIYVRKILHAKMKLMSSIVYTIRIIISNKMNNYINYVVGICHLEYHSQCWHEITNNTETKGTNYDLAHAIPYRYHIYIKSEIIHLAKHLIADQQQCNLDTYIWAPFENRSSPRRIHLKPACLREAASHSYNTYSALCSIIKLISKSCVCAKNNKRSFERLRIL